MRNKFVILVDSSNKLRDKKFADFLRNSSFGWWHWLNNAWLVVDGSGEMTLSELKDKVKSRFPKDRFIILEVGEN